MTTPAGLLRFPTSALSLQPSAFSLALTYAYDRNGNKIRTTERGTLKWPLPSLQDETARYTPAGRLIDREVAETITNHVARITYHYDPSGNLTNATGNGQSWTLAYDEDNRVTAFNWDGGLTSKINTNRYDAFGRRVARTIDGNEVRFVLDLATDMERVLCDVTPFGAITAWYVHGLDLGYSVDATETLTCYHADAAANIIAITGAGGTNLAQYAYTPYGRVLGSTNLQSQISNPYLFVGSQGVMEELPGLYFMRARYYSADAGVFLSTDPVKHIGPTWNPQQYAYAAGNPFSYSDPSGEFVVPAILLAAGIYYFVHETYLKPTEAILDFTEAINERQVGAMTKEQADAFQDEIALKPFELAPGGDIGIGVGYVLAGRGSTELKETLTGYIPGVTEFRILQHFGATLGYASIGIENSINSSRSQSRSTASPVVQPIQHTGGGASQSMANRTVASSTQPSILNPGQETIGSTPTTGNNSTSSGGGSGSSGRNTSSSGTSSSGGGSSTYTVRSGDTLGNIGYSHGTTAGAIWAANPSIKNPNLIYPNQVIIIPGRR